MNLEIITPSEAVKETQMLHISYIWNLKNSINGLIYKTETDSQTQKTIRLPKALGGGNQEYGINRYALLYIK